MPAETANPTSHVQASFRLNPETHRAIQEIARIRGLSKSEILRSSVELLRHTISLDPNIKLATVDVNDSRDTTYFRVVEWLLD